MAVDIALPSALRGKPVWVVEALSSGQLAVGFEGGLAVGTPAGAWQIVPSPNGQVVRAVSEAHGRTLVAGHGFTAFLDGAGMRLLAGPHGELLNLEAVPEGWLVAGNAGVWLIAKEGDETRRILPEANGANAYIRMTRINREVVVTSTQSAPQVWRDGGLATDPAWAAYNHDLLLTATESLRLTNRGVRDTQNRSALPPATNKKLLQAGLVGMAESGSWILAPTLGYGLFAIDRATGDTAWNTQKYGGIYYAKPQGRNYLLGTANGLFSIFNLQKAEYYDTEGRTILGLQVEEDRVVRLVTATGILHLDAAKTWENSIQWPESQGAEVRDSRLTFGDHRINLLTRYVNGLELAGDTVAVVQDQGLTLLDRAGTSRTLAIPAIAGSLATDGRNFLVGTATQGVQVVSPDGRVTGQLGAGRATARTVRPGKAVLLFWDGAILDSDANHLGHVAWGNPRDAAMIQDRLAVLVTRPDRDPVVGLLVGDTWQPLEVPGLAEIGAERIAATADSLYAAGPRGVIRVHLPLERSRPPAARWAWSAPVHAGVVQLDDAAAEHAGVRSAHLELAPAPATFLQVRKAGGAWEPLRAGTEFFLPVGWGRTPVTLRAERNGLVAESAFTIVRPWPWWLRTWAWPLHALVLGGAVVGLVRWRTRTLRRRNLELEARVSERTAQLRKASAAKEEFLASISHEIRNPLNGVVGICAMLADRDVGPGERVLVRTLGGCADQLRSMLDDILDFSRLDRSQVTLTNVDFEAGALVEEAARAMDPDLGACALMLPEQQVWLHGDSGKLRQIVCNLTSNALKYGVPREAGLEVRVVPAPGGRSRLRLAVRNSGPTIPAEEMNRLFESFQRGANTANIPGSGLGLAVCRRLAQAMGGRLIAASQDGVTEFALEVTLANAQPPAPKAGAPAPVSRALAIEDEDYNRIALGHVLRQLGYDVHWAADGAGALKLAATNQYDLVLTDWRLPDTDGGTLCRQLVALLPRPTPPIVAVTAYTTQEKLEEARAAGMTGFVTKPVTREKLERVILGLSEGLRPKRSLDTHTAGALAGNPLASLGDLAPSAEQLAAGIAQKWQAVDAMARLRDPRTGAEAHALRSLLLLAAEEASAEQVGLLEKAADAADWPAVQRLLPFVAEEITLSRDRLRT